MSTIRHLLGNRATDFIKHFLAIDRWQHHAQEVNREKTHNTKRSSFLSRSIPSGGVGAELGVFQGHFSPYLLNSLRPAIFHLIDPWYLLTNEWHWGHGNRNTVDAVINILKSHRDAIAARRVFVHVGDDRHVLSAMPDDYFDWVYIDSSHMYEHTLDELHILDKKMKTTGLIAGDDWQPDPQHRHHGVYRAVQEFLISHDYELVDIDDQLRQWIIRKTRR